MSYRSRSSITAIKPGQVDRLDIHVDYHSLNLGEMGKIRCTYTKLVSIADLKEKFHPKNRNKHRKSN